MVERSGGVQRGNNSGRLRKKNTKKFTEKNLSAHLETAWLKTLYACSRYTRKKQIDSYRNKNRREVWATRQIRSEWTLELRGGWFCETHTATSPAFSTGGTNQRAVRETRAPQVSLYTVCMFTCCTHYYKPSMYSMLKLPCNITFRNIFLDFFGQLNVCLQLPYHTSWCFFNVIKCHCADFIVYLQFFSTLYF